MPVTLQTGDIVTARATPYHDLIRVTGRRYQICRIDAHEGRPHYWGHPERTAPRVHRNAGQRKPEILAGGWDESQSCPLGDGSDFEASSLPRAATDASGED
jgi:hypothetical protein